MVIRSHEHYQGVTQELPYSLLRAGPSRLKDLPLCSTSQNPTCQHCQAGDRLPIHEPLGTTQAIAHCFLKEAGRMLRPRNWPMVKQVISSKAQIQKQVIRFLGITGFTQQMDLGLLLK